MWRSVLSVRCLYICEAAEPVLVGKLGWRKKLTLFGEHYIYWGHLYCYQVQTYQETYLILVYSRHTYILETLNHILDTIRALQVVTGIHDSPANSQGKCGERKNLCIGSCFTIFLPFLFVKKKYKSLPAHSKNFQMMKCHRKQKKWKK